MACCKDGKSLDTSSSCWRPIKITAPSSGHSVVFFWIHFILYEEKHSIWREKILITFIFDPNHIEHMQFHMNRSAFFFSHMAVLKLFTFYIEVAGLFKSLLIGFLKLIEVQILAVHYTYKKNVARSICT